MEVCGSAHYWARELQAMGHAARLVPPIDVKPYVKRGKNDDAAIEPRPWRGEPLRFVPVKSAASQATLMLHKTRELLIKQRTMSVNALHGDSPSKWWKSLISSFGSSKVFDGYIASPIHR
jgi:transposase